MLEHYGRTRKLLKKWGAAMENLSYPKEADQATQELFAHYQELFGHDPEEPEE